MSIYYVYLGTAHNLVKIGMTEDLYRRCSQHRSSNPVFKLLCFAEVATKQIASVFEMMLKERLGPCTPASSEWFSTDAEKAYRHFRAVVAPHATVKRELPVRRPERAIWTRRFSK